MAKFSQSWGSNDSSFYTNFTKYIAFCVEHREKPGQASRSDGAQKLAFWISNQKAKLKAGKMPVDRVAALMVFLNWAMPNGTQTFEEWLKQDSKIISEFSDRILQGDGFTKEELQAAADYLNARKEMTEDQLEAERREAKANGAKRGRKPKRRVIEEKITDPTDPRYVAPAVPWADEVKAIKTWKERVRDGEERKEKQENAAIRMAKARLERVKDTEGIQAQAVRTRDYGFKHRLSNADIARLGTCGFDSREDVYEQLSLIRWAADRMKYLETLGISHNGTYNIVNSFAQDWLGYRVRVVEPSGEHKGLSEPIKIVNGRVMNPLGCW